MTALRQYLSDDDGRTWHAGKVKDMREACRVELKRYERIEELSNMLVDEIDETGEWGDPAGRLACKVDCTVSDMLVRELKGLVKRAK